MHGTSCGLRKHFRFPTCGHARDGAQVFSAAETEKVVLVGHSLGGFNVALAAELFPDKVAAVVFLCALMPDHTLRPSNVVEKFIEGNWLDFMDTEMKPQDAEGKLPTSMLFGPNIDVTLATSLMRASSTFVEDLQVQQPYSEDHYGSVRKVYIVCKQDLVIAEGFQRWMIDNYPVEEVKEIDDADHSVMLSRPDELVRCLVDVADKQHGSAIFTTNVSSLSEMQQFICLSPLFSQLAFFFLQQKRFCFSSSSASAIPWLHALPSRTPYGRATYANGEKEKAKRSSTSSPIYKSPFVPSGTIAE
ncbi:hypothetical protein GUJ93_ZPchr0001g32870 [Zizania palustris]|uniref:AB hydrolase-1 domain-containing protein n=1 Tax=Zizania palustris TaxID=103762 RepID=A0A8J5VD70_ZIZPA|nr:hypothetical protein GUJ93_ZPchr0001g32870 [Zizania palustris]